MSSVFAVSVLLFSIALLQATVALKIDPSSRLSLLRVESLVLALQERQDRQPSKGSKMTLKHESR